MKNYKDLTRDQMIEYLIEQDPNGVYSDEDNKSEGFSLMTKEECIRIIEQWNDAEENGGY